MRVALAVLLVSAAASASAQPVAPRVLDATDAVGLPLGSSDEWEAPRVLYWAGVALDATALAAGAYTVVLGALLVDASDADDAGAGAFAGAVFGPFFLILGSAVVGVTAYDLIRVLRGDDPALARVFDPTRPLPPPGPPRFPVPGPRY